MGTTELLKEFYLLRHEVGDDLTAPSVLRTLMEAIAERRQYPAGEIIFRTGDAADALYVVESGSVDILAPDANPADGDTLVATLGPGDEFGEMAFFDGSTRSATARAGASCHVIRVSFDSLRDELRKRPEAAALLYRNAAAFLAHRLRTTTGDLSKAREKLLPHL